MYMIFEWFPFCTEDELWGSGAAVMEPGRNESMQTKRRSWSRQLERMQRFRCWWKQRSRQNPRSPADERRQAAQSGLPSVRGSPLQPKGKRPSERVDEHTERASERITKWSGFIRSYQSASLRACCWVCSFSTTLFPLTLLLFLII